MDSHDQETGYERVCCILKEMEKEEMLPVFKENEFNDVFFMEFETTEDGKKEMREELQNFIHMSSGSARRFSRKWFLNNKKDCLVNVKFKSKESLPQAPKTSLPQENSEKQKEQSLIEKNFCDAAVDSDAKHTDVPKFCTRRPFGQEAASHKYEEGAVFCNAEDENIEFKLFKKGNPQRLPWIMMEIARQFITGVLNAGNNGTIYFGIGDSENKRDNYKHGEVVGLEVEELKDSINKSLNIVLDAHVKNGVHSMSIAEKQAVKVYFIPVEQSGSRTNKYIVEIEVHRNWKVCKDHMYFIEEWKKSENWKKPSKFNLNVLYDIKKSNDIAYVRMCGSTRKVNPGDIPMMQKELSVKYEEWKVENDKKQLPELLQQESIDTQTYSKTSEDLRMRLQNLQPEINYILIASKVPQRYRETSKLSFLKFIPWLCVFDLFDKISESDGLYYILNKTNDSAHAILKNLGDVNNPSTFTKRATTWILRSQELYDQDWIRFSKKQVYEALSAAKEESPTKKHWVILCLNDEFLEEMADMIDYLFTILGKEANKTITIISEKKDIGERLVKPLKETIRKDLKYPSSYFGLPLEILKKNVQEMLGQNGLHEPHSTTDLPYVLDRFVPVLNKRIKSLTDLEVFCPKSPTWSRNEIKKVREDFYRGDVIQQLNLFHRHDIERTLQKKLMHKIERCLIKLSDPKTSEFLRSVEIVNLRYEPGSGATTLCRRILWDEKQKYRCAIVKSIEADTDYQIDELHRFAYEAGDCCIPPVLILVDKFPEQSLNRLVDKLFERRTKCVLLNTIPINTHVNISREEENNDAVLPLLDDDELERIKKILTEVEGKDEEQKKAAEDKLKKEKRIIWLGLELFGQECSAEIVNRLSNYIQHTIGKSPTSRLKDACQTILHFSSFLDYYSKGQYNYPHAILLDILSKNYGLDEDFPNEIKYVHDMFGGLIIEDYCDSGGYPGWRPAHFLVGKVIRKEMNLVETVKNFFTEKFNNDSRAKKNFIKNVVHVCLQRDKVHSKNSGNFESDPELSFDEDDSGEKEKYSALLLDVMAEESEDVSDALDVLITMNVNVETDEQKAHSYQQLARVLAYEIGGKPVKSNDMSLLSQLPLSCIAQDSSSIASGFQAAHDVIDLAVKVQPTHTHHLVTKGTFFKSELQNKLIKTTRPEFASVNFNNFGKQVINITKEGIERYDDASKTSQPDDGYYYALIGKIHIIIVMLEIFKNFPCFSDGEQGKDDIFKHCMTFGEPPEQLKILLEKEDLEYFLLLRTIPAQLLDELFAATEERRKQLSKTYKIMKIKNANRRGYYLRKKFYDVTKLDRIPFESHPHVPKGDIVQDILFQYEETTYTSWKKLPPPEIEKIYTLTKQARENGSANDRVMLIHAKAALKLSHVCLEDLFQHVKNWCVKYQSSKWANLFNYMISFPTPNGSLKANVPVVNQSIEICKNRSSLPQHEYRKSSAEYFLGKGIGIKAILPIHEFDDTNKKIEKESGTNGSSKDMRSTEFWRSKDVFEKLERLCGKKVLGKKGLLEYKGIEIMFDHERYPKESRDDLWFCLGFTLNGPYAYDPVNDEKFSSIKQNYSDENFAMVYSKKAKQNAHNSPPSTKLSVVQNTKKTNDWMSNKNLIALGRSPGGHQEMFKPKRIDCYGRVQHGALVMGAPKSVKCRRQKCVFKKCQFAHPPQDPQQQTICSLCTKANKEICENKTKHSSYFFNLGPFLHVSGSYMK